MAIQLRPQLERLLAEAREELRPERTVSGSVGSRSGCDMPLQLAETGLREKRDAIAVCLLAEQNHPWGCQSLA